MRPGTSPSNRSTSACASPSAEFALARKKPVGLRIVSSSSRSAPASATASGYVANRVGVTLLTILSVVCADSTVATSSSKALVKSSSQCASGWMTASSRAIRRARRVRPRAVSPGSNGDAPVRAATVGRRTGAGRA